MTVLGPFTLLEKLGQGGVGAVHRARDERSGREVALKLLLDESATDEESRRRMQREGEAAARLRHPNIVTVHEAGVIERRRYLSMELIAGSSFEKLLDARGVDRRRAVELLRDVARAVHHAHLAGIVHRDLKPANIMVREDGTPVVMDFGLARLVDARTQLTRTGTSLGTPAYMSPEQADGQKGVDARSDVYSLGAILYTILAGRRPFAEISGVNLVAAVLTKDLPPPSTIDPTAAGDLEAVCLAAMARATDDRHPTAESFARELDRWLRGERVLSRRRRRLPVAAIAVAVIVAAAGAALLLRNAPPPAPEPPPPPPSRRPPPPKPRPVGPAWYEALEAARRPELPLPEGIEFGGRGEYVNAKDGSVLLFVADEKPFQVLDPPREGGAAKPRWVRCEGFFIGKLEVTRAQLDRFVLETGRKTAPETANEAGNGEGG
jgi:serine/threonine protein kinase